MSARSGWARSALGMVRFSSGPRFVEVDPGLGGLFLDHRRSAGALPAEIGLLEREDVGANFVDGPLEDDEAVVADEHPVRDGECQRDVLLDDEHGVALVTQRADRFPELLGNGRRQPERQLVDHQDRRVRHDPPAERHHLLFAAREQPAPAVRQFGQARQHAFASARRAARSARSTPYAARRRFSRTVCSGNNRRPSGTCAA